MPRANQLRGDGGIFHLTHRCHNHAFLLKFARDRESYRTILRRHLRPFGVSLLDYCITSNHVHLLVDAGEQSAVSGLMRDVAGEFARAYNRRKLRSNAFWGDNYHSTLVESGEYLWRCLCYIELNMVRCGVVTHPRDWRWVGYHEIAGSRRRYRLIDLERLCWRVRAGTLAEVQKRLAESLAEIIARDEMKREPCWTESIAVGSMGFVEQARPRAIMRRDVAITESPGKVWVLHEATVPYGQKTNSKSAAKAII